MVTEKQAAGRRGSPGQMIWVLITAWLLAACNTQPADPVAVKNLQQGRAFLTQNKARKNVVTLPSGLQYRILKHGSGISPMLPDTVTLHYRGMHIDGSEFDNTYARGSPVVRRIRTMIPGWRKALLLMSEGAKWRVFIPHYLAYTNRGKGEISPNEVLIYDIELLRINWREETPKF